MKLPNEAVFDERLGRIARSILAELIARPPGWQTNAAKLWETADRHRGARADQDPEGAAARRGLRNHDGGVRHATEMISMGSTLVNGSWM
ncbi:hypothetical protein ABZ746_26815 [Streptomyces sp. NPDC020096]